LPRRRMQFAGDIPICSKFKVYLVPDFIPRSGVGYG
jgi:hypothetical protein